MRLPVPLHPPLLSGDVHPTLSRWCSHVGLYQWTKALQNQLQNFTPTRNIPGGGGTEGIGNISTSLQHACTAITSFPSLPHLQFFLSKTGGVEVLGTRLHCHAVYSLGPRFSPQKQKKSSLRLSPPPVLQVQGERETLGWRLCSHS